MGVLWLVLGAYGSLLACFLVRVNRLLPHLVAFMWRVGVQILFTYCHMCLILFLFDCLGRYSVNFTSSAVRRSGSLRDIAVIGMIRTALSSIFYPIRSVFHGNPVAFRCHKLFIYVRLVCA